MGIESAPLEKNGRKTWVSSAEIPTKAKRAPINADFKKRRALMLPKEARYDELLKLPKGADLGAALVKAMEAIERDFEPLLNQLPKEYKTSNLRLAKMNLAVHALDGDIVEANTLYEDPHELFGKCDFVMANPPFNVDKVDAEKVKHDRRLPFGLPGMNKEKKMTS